jgi:hypothetical protein
MEEEELQKIVNNKDELKQLLFNHIHKGKQRDVLSRY